MNKAEIKKFNIEKKRFFMPSKVLKHFHSLGGNYTRLVDYVYHLQKLNISLSIRLGNAKTKIEKLSQTKIEFPNDKD